MGIPLSYDVVGSRVRSSILDTRMPDLALLTSPLFSLHQSKMICIALYSFDLSLVAIIMSSAYARVVIPLPASY